MKLTLEGLELMGLYILLRNHESEIDETLSTLLDRVENIMFSTFSIEEVEKIDELYRKNVDVFAAHRQDDRS
jgi:hypothetical protein